MVPVKSDSQHFREPKKQTMSRRLNRVWLLLLCFITGEVWALGLGDIQLDSALNEPLRAEIQLISATPDELANLIVTLASAETFDRYSIDRPLFMSGINFQIVASGRTDGNVIRVTSTEPVTEPFLTFLVEAAWSRGRLLREYTLLLIPPTFAQPATTQAPPIVSAPTRTTPADSGRIERTQPARSEPPPRPERIPPPARVEPREEPIEELMPMPAPRVRVADEPQAAPVYDDTPVGDFNVLRDDTLWGIANRVREDSRLTINQMMLAIYEANPQAFAGNINRLSAGATLRIPTADEVFSISRGDALSEVQRQHAAWGGEPGVVVSPPEPSLTLVPPDEDVLTSDSSAVYDDDDLADTSLSDQEAVDLRIFEVRGMLLDNRDGLIVIGDNELAVLQQELVGLTGEELPPELMPADLDTGVDDDPVDSEIFVDDAGDVDDSLQTDDAGLEDSDTDQASAETPPDRVAAPPVRSRDEPGLVDTIIAAITGIWGLIGGALVLVAAVLVWFARRAAHGDDEESTGMWEALDSGDIDEEARDTTERLRALTQEDSSAMVVVEEAAAPEIEPATMEMPAMEPEPAPENDMAPEFVPEEHADAVVPDIGDALGDTGTAKSIEDTFSSDTASNLDQSDPVAEADFHMAYGLYDQAADLINGALEVESERPDLLTKLCEIYFVWGNRDSFVDAATRLKNVSSGEQDSEWDKIVIMGQQIAADHELFADAQLGAATRAVDLSFDAGEGEVGELDLDFAAESDIDDGGTINLGVSFEEGGPAPGKADSIDFAFNEADADVAVTQAMPSADALGDAADEATLSVDAPDDGTDSPTVEEQLAVTSEMPVIPSNAATEIASLDDLDADATAEIDLDDLGLETTLLPPRCLSRTEAARYLGIGRTLLSRIGPPPIRLGRRRVYDRVDLDRWLDDHRSRPDIADSADDESPTAAIAPSEMSADLHDARTMTEVGTKLDLARAYVDMGDPSGARIILEEVLAEGDEAQRQQAQQLLESLPG